MNKLINGILLRQQFADGAILFHEEKGCDLFRSEYYATMGETNTWIDKCRHHLFILSDEPVRPGDWFFNPFTEKVGKVTNYSRIDNFKKIEASTDPRMKLPNIPQHFLEYYATTKGMITHIAIERHTVIGGPVVIPESFEINILMIGMKYGDIKQQKELTSHE